MDDVLMQSFIEEVKKAKNDAALADIITRIYVLGMKDESDEEDDE